MTEMGEPKLSKKDKMELEELTEWFSTTSKLSQRAVAVIAAADLDQELDTLLRAFFIDHTKLDELLSGAGPLATFSARIQIAFASGLISDRERHNLDLIRRIRNEFAHRRGFEISFDTPEIRSRCLELQPPKEINGLYSKTNEARDRFIETCGFLLQVLVYRNELTTHREKQDSITEEIILARLKEAGVIPSKEVSP